MSSFIDIVGYQLEKIHTGVIAWLLESDTSPLSIVEILIVIEKLFCIEIKKENVISSKTTREYSFGRSLRIDLVIEIEYTNSDKIYFLVECKTDSDCKIEQLEKSIVKFSNKFPDNSANIGLLVLGASQATLDHIKDDLIMKGVAIIDLIEAKNIFFNFITKDKSHVLNTWIESLTNELERMKNIDQFILKLDDPRDKYLIEKRGYRSGFPFFYYYYYRLKHELSTNKKEWAIHSGGNNPVLNWRNGYINVNNERRLKLYWEFNWTSFRLKAHIVEENYWELWQNVRTELIPIIHNSNGKVTANRKGTYVTVGKWEMDITNVPIPIIAKDTLKLLSIVHPELIEKFA